MLEFSPIFGMTDEVELTDTELEAIHGGRGRHHGGGYFGNPYGGFNGYGYIPTEVLLLTPTTIVPSDVSTAPSTTDFDDYHGTIHCRADDLRGTNHYPVDYHGSIIDHCYPADSVGAIARLISNLEEYCIVDQSELFSECAMKESPAYEPGFLYAQNRAALRF